MKKILLMIVCALMCSVSFAQNLTKENKALAKEELKKFEKNGWKGAGADAKMKEAIERSYVYIQDEENYVVAEAAASQIDAKNAIEVATNIAQRKAMEKARDVLKDRGFKKIQTSDNFIKVLTLYRDHKKREDGSEAFVRVALKLN